MLWYKAWLETRTRFVVSLVGMSALSALRVYQTTRLALRDTGIAYYYLTLHWAHVLLCLMWVLAVALLMMGGLLREKAVGASAFTLSLPVSRRQLMGARIGVGAAEAALLGAVPWAAMYATAVWIGKADSTHEALYHLGLLLGFGSVFFGIPLLVSSLVEGEYAAPLVSLGLAVAMAVLDDGALRAYNPHVFMQGGDLLDRHTHLFVHAFPWERVAACLALTAAMCAGAVAAVEKREF
jgi:ABC-2 type transport system permease protein